MFGEPLQRRVSIDNPELAPVVVGYLIDALRALATVPCTDNMRHVPDFGRRFDALATRLAEIPPIAPTVIHGDLFGENILVDPAGRPSAVLDFGFLTTGGDPRLGAGITAAIANMYGKHAAV